MPATESLDAWMTQAGRDDDPDAYARVVEACHYTIRAILLRDTADEELADELAQDALVQAWAKRKQYRPGTSPRAWLLAIARSKLVEHYRHQDKTRRHKRELVRRELLRHLPVRDEHREQLLEALRECLADLDERQQRLLELIHGKGMTTYEAAAVLEVKPATCRQRISRLQRALRACTEQHLQDKQR